MLCVVYVLYPFLCVFYIGRRKLDQANTKLRKVLMEIMRSTVATEELIGQKICSRAKSSEIQSVITDSQTAGLFNVFTENTSFPSLDHCCLHSL